MSKKKKRVSKKKLRVPREEIVKLYDREYDKLMWEVTKVEDVNLKTKKLQGEATQSKI